MADDNPLFRKVALERLSNPEQLDQLMEVTSPRLWLALAGLAVIVVAALGWSVFGTIPEKVASRGIFLTTGGTVRVTAAAGGQLVGFSLAAGDRISAGDLLARVAQPELAVDFARAQAECDRVRAEYASKSAEGLDEDVRLNLLANTRRREATNLSIRNLREYLVQLESKVRTQEELLAQGLVVPQTVLSTKREVTDAQERIRQHEVDLISIAAEAASLRKTPEGTLEQLQKELQQAEAALQQQLAKLEIADRIESPFTGRVLEVFTYDNDRITAGAPVCTLELTDTAQQRLEAVLLVAAADAARVRAGQAVMLSPDNARKEEYGMLAATVDAVAGYPTSIASINRYLNNEALARAIAGEDAVVEIRATLTPDPATPSGYRWSSSRGYPEPPRSGTLCAAEIVVTQKRPITLVIPALKSLVNVD